MSDNLSLLGKARIAYQPKLPTSLRNGPLKVGIQKGAATESVRDQAAVKALFPNTYGAPVVSFDATGSHVIMGNQVNIGVVLSGGQAPGGHNVIAGIFDGIKANQGGLNMASTLRSTVRSWINIAIPADSTSLDRAVLSSRPMRNLINALRRLRNCNSTQL